MKYIVKTYIFLLIVLMIFASGCEDYLDINEDPNNPTQVSMSSLLAYTSFETGDNVQNIGETTSYYVQYLASPNQANATDIHDNVAFDQTWFELYDVMTDLSDLEILAEELGATDYLGVAKILKAFNLGLTVDMWGDIPYEEAFFAQTLTPAYDDDQALYTEIQNLLDAGVAELQKGTSTAIIGEDDFIFAGDTEKWIKTAYALKARYLLHLSETSAFDAQAVLSAVAQGFESNEDDATVVYFDQQINPWADVAIDNANLLLGGWISEQLVQAMEGTTFGVVDPRMPFMFGTTDDGEFVGTPNGAGRGDASEQGARSTLVTGTFYADRTAPILLITYAEQKFIEAEAALNVDPTRAYEAYLEGISAHMDKIGVDPADRDAYLGSPAVSVGANNLTRDLIMKEKYVAMFLHPEAWVDARRYDYQYEDMTLPANHNPALGGEFIRRVIYPESETTRNGSNVPQVTLADRMWWDQ